MESLPDQAVVPLQNELLKREAFGPVSSTTTTQRPLADTTFYPGQVARGMMAGVSQQATDGGAVWSQFPPTQNGGKGLMGRFSEVYNCTCYFIKQS